jgi:hypothetical protein
VGGTVFGHIFFFFRVGGVTSFGNIENYQKIIHFLHHLNLQWEKHCFAPHLATVLDNGKPALRVEISI